MANGHGGRRAGSGRKAKPLADKLLDGNPSKRRPVVVNLPSDNADNVPRECPKSLTEFAFLDINPSIEGVYEQTVKWLEGTKCLHLINPALITEYAILKTRWLECEFMVAQKPVIETAGGVTENPMIGASIKYLRAANEIWDRIWAVVSQNSSMYYGDDPNRDIMAQLLNSKPR